MGDNIVDVKSCPYKGDGLRGWGEVMAGFATSHGMSEESGDTTTGSEMDEFKRLVEDVATDYAKDIHHMEGAQLDCFVNAMARACSDYMNNYWTVQQAIDDVREITEAMFETFKDEVIPRILHKQCTHGLYNDTSTKLIADRAYSEVQEKATALTLDNINQYFKNYQQLAQTLLGFIQQAIADSYHEAFDQDVGRKKNESNETYAKEKICHNKTIRKSLNGEDLAIEMGILVVASVVFKKLLNRDYAECGGKG